jgi:hypothetical protein
MLTMGYGKARPVLTARIAGLTVAALDRDRAVLAGRRPELKLVAEHGGGRYPRGRGG